MNRCTLEALIVLDVHNKDVVKNLVDQKISEITDFAWFSQLRYYWENSDTVVRIINAQVQYNYEYLGNSPRLVITPLTDRCYRTLCGAIHLNYGGAPEGPAGTGKTETVKDLAKALARQCVVFNCSDGLDYKAMGKFFKGLASSGAWSCFDEFNRIDLEVLSVIAQQILTIQIAVGQKKSSFDFEGSHIKLKLTANCFITMNPGYAGRSELPDNLKALFRSVAMMVPDYALIAEISLYSFGFEKARTLAQKIVTTYKLCSEQLSSQDHYDYGMRAVKSVLTAAGNLLRKYPNEDEYILVLRAINDVNLAKFLSFDLPLFKGITSDLFPGTELPPIDYSALLNAIDNQIKNMKLQKTEYFVEKIIQLYEMIRVRHGLMVVGWPFAGKTSILRVLAAALGELCEKNLMGEQKVQVTYLNPKSISMKQLYGYNDDATQEWTDGVLAVKYKAFAKSESEDRKWLVFDGPIDAVWIENMNTVLDDNKKLCLNSGEIIAMSKSMNMIFEPMDLLAASPATVSRCGMVYLEPANMGWKPIFDSWRENELPKTFTQDEMFRITDLFDQYIDPLLKYHRKSCHETSPTQDQNLVRACMKIYGALLKPFNDEVYFNSIEIKSRLNILDNYFIFALIWSLGGSLTGQSRRNFDVNLKKIANGGEGKKKLTLPDKQLYEYIYQINKGQEEGTWTLWTDLINPNETIPAKMQPQEIIVKTTDTVRYSYLVDLFIKNEIDGLFCGPTGTGKSVYIKNVLNQLSKDKYLVIDMAFSAQTSSNQTQDIVDGSLTRRKKGHFGPPIGKRTILFVDDLNMPSKEKYGAQPPIEILRQLLDQGGWYDLKDKERPFAHILDFNFISAMGPPGGGRTFITPRITRHLNLVSFTNFDDDTLKRIFNTILHWYFGNNGFPADIVKLENKLVTGTLEIYQKAIEELRPTPMKSHYLFNLRDFSKVILGICMSDKDRVNEVDQMTRLWMHEVWRVFADRLVSDEDKLLLFEHIKEIVRKTFGVKFDTVFARLDNNGDGKVDRLDEVRGLMFTDIMSANQVKNYYEEVTDFSKLQESVETSLGNYNILSDKPMDLVMFSFAVEHLLIIGRILKQPGGNALLIGVGGSGRQSLTRLAAHIKEYHVKQIEITKNYGKTEWRDDLKLLLKNAGGKGNPTVFLFTDSQIKEESFVEDINTLLNSGEVPNLFPPDEKAELMEMVRASARSEGKAPDGTPSQLFGYFVERVKKMLHIVMCFSPIGEALRNRIRMFPSLVNCCTIDWFSAWPGDALYSVAKKFMKEIDMDGGVREKCEEMLQFFHVSTTNWAGEFFKSLKRKYYVTPTSYLEMIITFKSLLAEKRKEVLANKNKYENGYDKIIVTESLVGEMQISLTDLKPKLEKASKDTAIKLNEVTVQKGEADKVKAVVSAEEEIASKAAGEANAIKRECEGELEKALPLLREAESALKVLTKKDFDEMKAYKIPPNPVKLTCQAVLLLTKRVKVERKPNKSGEMEYQWWEASVKMLGDSSLMEYLLNFKESIDDVDEPTVKRLGDFLNENKDSLTKDAVKSSSTAAAGLIMWVNGIYNFYFVNKEIKPKKEKLAKAEAEAKALMDQLAIKQKQLKDVNDKVDKLTRELNDAERNKAKLEAQYNDVLKKLDRATKLIDSLGSEKGRWKELGGILSQVYINLTGDILVSAGMIAYLGAFTSAFRSQISEEWVLKCRQAQIPSSEAFSLQQVLGDPVKIRDWNISGLPSDAFSIENGIIISKSRRWPLCIDPQGQANKWIKNMGKDSKISITKLSDPDLLRTLENSIQFGRTVLIENVYEDLDPSLSPILLKQTFQKGNTIYIKIGDQTIEYNPAFRLYITTKLRNPHYLPEISTQVTLLNFMITLEGLNDQLLGIVVKKERPELENEKERLIIEGANNKRRLFELEEEILKVLSEAKNILEDEKGVEILTASKLTSNEIKEKQTVAEQTEKDIDAARTLYRPVSNEASCLFFAITDLANIDPMYQYSLTYFIDLFSQAISKSEQSSDLEIRLGNLKTYFLYSLYSNICRSLFEKDKLLFSFLLSTRLKDFRKELNSEQYRFLLTGGVSLGEQLPEKPNVVWLSDKAWAEICRMSALDNMGGLHKSIKENLDGWKVIYDSPNPHKETMPEPQQSALSKFEKLLVLRALRPDKMIPAVQDFVAEDLGAKFIDPPAFDLEKVYKDSSSTTPLIFVLSPGSDPFANLYKFAEKMNKQVVAISLGQGQGEKASMAIKEGCETGGWVVLQNCHLAIRWMPVLEKICEELNPDPKFTHPEFRLWLTSYPSPDFPVAILQSGVKMTNEPPKGLRANLMRSYLTDPISDANFFESCRRGPEFKKLLYGLCFFHAVIQERRKFGPLGWNIPYEFTDSDLRISARQLHMFLHEESELIPFDALKYLTAECNYGGRVTDDKDRRLITTLLDDFYCQGIVSDENYTFSSIEFYKAPRTNDYDETLEFIKGFPLIVEPEVFGLHANADITKDIGETNLLLDSLLLCQSESGSSESTSQEDVLKKLIDSIRSDFPGPFDIQKASEKYPVSYKESMNTVLTQELGRFNNLIKVVISSLENIRDAMDGKVLLSSQLERASKSLYDGKVPEIWMEKSYPSLKPLGGYIKNLKERLDFFRKWIEEGQPNTYWLSGFFFTQSFLTGVLQNFARKYTIAIDLVKFDFEVLRDVFK